MCDVGGLEMVCLVDGVLLGILCNDGNVCMYIDVCLGGSGFLCGGMVYLCFGICCFCDGNGMCTINSGKCFIVGCDLVFLGCGSVLSCKVNGVFVFFFGNDVCKKCVFVIS